MKLLIGFLLAVTLAACATPTYQTRYEFIPPANQQGIACLQRCTAQDNQCKAGFNTASQQCLVKSRQQALLEMPGRLKAYENALDVWELRMNRYQRDISMYELERRHYRMMRGVSSNGCRGERMKHHQDCRRYPLRWGSTFRVDEPVYPGKAPRRPTIKAVTAEIAKESCAQGNQCAANYRQCYTSCGGSVRPYQFRPVN